MTSYAKSLAEGAMIEQAKRELSRRHFPDFVNYINEGYTMKWFHRVIAEKCQLVLDGKIKKLMIFVPPQHGKSELATRNFPAFALGKNPNLKIGIISYSASTAEKLGKSVQRRVESSYFKNIFPEKIISNGRDDLKKTNGYFETSGGGYCVSVGVDGPLTSMAIDLGIIDDPIKDRKEAKSLTIRQNVYEYYVDVFSTRLHNNSSQILIQTRWDEDDLAGRLLRDDGIFSELNPQGWTVVKFPAIKENDINKYDPRSEGEALWPEKHSLEKILSAKRKSLITFNSLYQQDPKPDKESLIYDWSEIDVFPEDAEIIFSGGDFGYSNDPTAVVRIAKIGKNLIFDEIIYEAGLTNPMIASKLKDYAGRTGEFYFDSAEPKSCQELRNLGIKVIDAVKGADSVRTGILKLQEYECYYTSRSINIKREVSKYEWIVVGGKKTNIPIDNYNHTLDAIRYAIYTKYSKPRKLITG